MSRKTEGQKGEFFGGAERRPRGVPPVLAGSLPSLVLPLKPSSIETLSYLSPLPCLCSTARTLPGINLIMPSTTLRLGSLAWSTVSPFPQSPSHLSVTDTLLKQQECLAPSAQTHLMHSWESSALSSILALSPQCRAVHGVS